MVVPISAPKITPSTTPLLQRETVDRFRDLGVSAMGVSLDGPTAEIHDAFRNVPGTFDYSQQALQWAREQHIPAAIQRPAREQDREAGGRCRIGVLVD